MAFLFRENRRHGTDGRTNRQRQTNGVQHLMRPPLGKVALSITF